MRFANKNWYYNYRELFSITNERTFIKCNNDILMRYSRQTKNWSEVLNSEWTCRIYLASKMILNSTVILKQSEFSRQKNLRMSIPYLEYYSILSLLRGVVFTLPDIDWDNGELLKISHAKAINLTCDWIAKFSKSKASEIKDKCLQLKAQRELISYKAPASGDKNLGDTVDVEYMATLLSEIAQYNSELLESSVKKNTRKEHHVLLSHVAEKVCDIEIEGYNFFDNEDAYRLSYIHRKQPYPFNINLFMTEGQTEDFIGAWDPEDYDEDSDEHIFYSGSPSQWQNIFDIP